MSRNKLFRFLYKLTPFSLLISNRQVPVLLFHRVHPVYDAYTEPLHPREFEKTLKLLSKHYQVLSLDHYLSTEKIRKPSCLITFDDGTLDFKEYALPALEKYRLPATVFLPTHSMETEQPTWNLRYFHNFAKATKKQFTYILDRKSYNFDLAQSPQYTKVMQLLDQVYTKTFAEKEEIIRQIQELAEPTPSPLAPLMTWNDIREIYNKSDLVSFESHSHRHELLTGYSPEELEEDLHTAHRRVTENTGACRCLAYPVGQYDQTVTRTAGKHYQASFTTVPESAALPADMNEEEKQAIPRFNISDKTAEEIFFRINGFHNLITKFR